MAFKDALEALKHLTNSEIKSGVVQSDRNDDVSFNESGRESSLLSEAECIRFLQALSEVSPHFQPMFLKHFVAFFAPRGARGNFTYNVFIADQQQLLAAVSAPHVIKALNMDLGALASAAVAALSPYLAKFGEAAAKKAGEAAADGGGRLFGWLRNKLGSRGQEALDDLAAKPESEDNQADLRKQIVKALEADPSLAAVLRALLPAEAGDSSTMTQTVSGAGAKGVQIGPKSSHNTVTQS